MTATPRRHWLADLLVKQGSPDAANLAVSDDATPEEIWNAAAQIARITPDEVTRRVAAGTKYAVANLDHPESRAQILVPESLARRHLVFPIHETDRSLVVATWNPTDLDAEQALGFAAGRSITFEIASPKAIAQAIDAHYAPDDAVNQLLDRAGISDGIDVTVVEEQAPETVAAQDLDAAPVVKLTGIILADAVKAGVSDIHMEPGREGGVVRFRIDGVLRVYMRIPMTALNRVVSRIKVMGKLDIADRLRPQDGRARVQLAGKVVDLRLSTVPTRDAEKAVIRILDPSNSKKLEDLNVSKAELERFRRLLLNRDGIVVVTGPTGSGKTTTLYAALREIATGEVNVMTVEDPVEYELPGMTQIQVEPKRNVTFASALRSILRQDPNVIFVGEIRDLETAEIAVQAAYTGHLVLATIHANDAAGSVDRFIDLGLDRAKVTGTLRGALAQRLVRRLCPSCAQAVDRSLTPAEQKLAERYGVRPVKRAVGCDACAQAGYRGRITVMEVMVGSSTNGMRPMRDSALERVAAGETTLEEVERVLGGAGAGGETEAVATAAPAAAHILVVDDDNVNRMMAKAVLEKGGFRVSEAKDGVEALEQLQHLADVQVMVLDLDMPRLGGAEVLERVRHAKATAALPVIVLTGSESGDTEVEIMERGADDYVRKPIDGPRFVARVKAALRRAGS
ncbi:MAG TPA: ATPase, T2SS/T4P/T4SS family [Gemmatimonadales bacterium]|jgi:type II secretory ATPase GspE/PulE/Tfp pilus assembly ATPase PilB-like protein/ActR/RegA family two-component response regulator|nr:ATPase, T2SS/T4P/T4SS family [Gemmatimonadales bacterium]